MIKSDKDFMSAAESDFLATGVVRFSPCSQDIGEPGSPFPALEVLLGSRPPGQASEFPNEGPAFPPGFHSPLLLKQLPQPWWTVLQPGDGLSPSASLLSQFPWGP